MESIWELLEKALESLEGPFRASGVLKRLASGSNHLEVVSGVHAGFGMGIQKGSALPPTPCFALQRLLKDPCYPMGWSRIHQIWKLFFIARVPSGIMTNLRRQVGSFLEKMNLEPQLRPVTFQN